MLIYPYGRNETQYASGGAIKHLTQRETKHSYLLVTFFATSNSRKNRSILKIFAWFVVMKQAKRLEMREGQTN